ncbi:glycosyltransferase family 9 protein [Alteromonas facilis]|uniref:glycosyltransferase family 9 protein n=1 Tax=Alteromonas facilis TaxID=2048004 RepID=UPI000C28EDAB|nr:glycosyltransferase family 9 protein [Alteromonas facilis]
MRLSAIGDVCHAVAMVQAIQQQRPDINITWVIGKIEHALLDGLPGVEFIVFDKKQGKQAVHALKQQMQGRHFDVLLMMQVALRANWVSRVIPAKIRIGFDPARSKELHSCFTNHTVAPQQHAHVLDGFMGFAAAIGISPPQTPHWNMPISAEEQMFAGDLAHIWGEYVVICPAASKAERCWLPERYAAVADAIAESDKTVILCGSPAALDTTLGNQIQQLAQQQLVNMIGKTSLKQLLAILATAELVIAPDTGPAHMATTVSTPVVGLYAHSNPRRTGPYLDIDHAVSVYDDVIEEQTGKTWQRLNWGKRAKGADLMSRISVEDVLAKVKEILTL